MYTGQARDHVEPLPGESAELLFTEHDGSAARQACEIIEQKGSYPVDTLERLYKLATYGRSHRAHYWLGSIAGVLPPGEELVDYAVSGLPREASGLCAGYDNVVGHAAAIQGLARPSYEAVI